MYKRQPQENSLTVVGGMTSMSQPFEPEGYRGLNILVAKNLHYLACLLYTSRCV